ncbi:MAG: Ig-like domain-containing protein, partial [Candidatus Cloacimonetes bacterium]|nr:Ig-like domain-containing protein [Candidatus Cloacimonadota bacterium]
TLTIDAVDYTPGTTQNMTFIVTNGSTDTEWLKGVNVTFPTGVTVNSATNFVGGSGGDLVPTPTSGNGITIDWFGETSSNWGVIQGEQTATATVNVSIAPSFGGTMNLPFQIVGDDYNAEPHTLSGTLTVAQAIPPITWLSVQPLSGSIAAGQNQLITGYFSAIGMAVGSYYAALTIHSNDPINPTMEVTATMDVSVGNRPPQINLPANFTFEKNGSLVQSLASYINDPDSDPITLSVTGNSNVTVDISGSSVTFAALQNWCGTETITFTVNDGEFNASDNMDIIVTPTDMPAWEPVVYPTNPATVYAVVTIDNIPAQLNDMVAAFVNGECRATGEIVMIDRAFAYTTLVVNLANSGETVSFQIYAHATDTVYPVQETMPMATGAVYGDTTPVPLNGTLNVTIAQPTLVIQSTISGTKLTWAEVPHANNYQIWACNEPYGTYTLIGTTSSFEWNINPNVSKMFYYIRADNNAPAKGTK